MSLLEIGFSEGFYWWCCGSRITFTYTLEDRSIILRYLSSLITRVLIFHDVVNLAHPEWDASKNHRRGTCLL